jgi:hypothetical protein
VWGEVVVLEGGVERLRVPLEAEMPIKAMLVGHAKGEMPPDMRLLPLEPLVKSMAAAEAGREFTTGESWRRRQHHHQEYAEHQPAMSRHDPSPLPMVVPALRCEARERL